MGLLSWLDGAPAAGGAKPLKASELLQKISSGEKLYLVDVRQPEELTGPLGALPGVKNIPLPDFGSRFIEVPKDREVIILCRSGNRSSQAVSLLIRQGYTRIQNLEGGMLAVRALQPK
jgi:rhodanese-related sulfurtransferase